MFMLSYFFALGVIVSVPSGSNPVFIRIRLVALIIMVFFSLLIGKGRVWLRSIFFIIFIGGILIMFITLISLMPREKAKKLKNFKTSRIFLALLTMGAGLVPVASEIGFNQERKIGFLSNGRIEIIVILILVYFISFIQLISAQKSTLRSFDDCYKL